MVTVFNRGVPAEDYGSPFFLREYTRNVISADCRKLAKIIFEEYVKMITILHRGRGWQKDHNIARGGVSRDPQKSSRNSSL